MSVDFYPCDACKEVFCACGSYVRCPTCGAKWCSNRCASVHGFSREEDSCKWCRTEDLEDYILIPYLLKLLEWTRSEAVEAFKEEQRINDSRN